MSIHEDNPLGMMLGKEAADAPSAEEGDADADMASAADALIKATHDKDAVGVADAFKAMYACCKPGEDDMEMAPSSPGE